MNKKLKILLIGGFLASVVVGISLGVGLRIAFPRPSVAPIDPQLFLNQQVERVQHKFAVLDFYNSKDAGGVEHLKALRQVVQDPAYADWVEVIPIDIADEANLRAAKAFLSPDVWEVPMPYTLVVKVFRDGCVATAGNAFIPEIYGTPERQIREALDNALKRPS